jgi:hypothetical protein
VCSSDLFVKFLVTLAILILQVYALHVTLLALNVLVVLIIVQIVMGKTIYKAPLVLQLVIQMSTQILI